jgi:hypothetical protein
LICKTNVIPGQQFDPSELVLLHFNHPISKKGDFADLFFLEDTVKKRIWCGVSRTEDTLALGLPDTVLKIGTTEPDWGGPKDTIRLVVFKNFKEDKNYKLFIPPGYFTDIFGQKNDTIKLGFKTHEQKYYGTLKLKLNVPHGGYVLQLLDSKDAVVKEEQVEDGNTFFYDYITPGNYKLKLIIEKNSDHQWTPGNYLEKKQPEKVVYYNQPLIIRSDWDLEIEWKPEY